MPQRERQPRQLRDGGVVRQRRQREGAQRRALRLVRLHVLQRLLHGCVVVRTASGIRSAAIGRQHHGGSEPLQDGRLVDRCVQQRGRQVEVGVRHSGNYNNERSG